MACKNHRGPKNTLEVCFDFIFWFSRALQKCANPFSSLKLEFIIQVLQSRHFDWSVFFLSVHQSDLHTRTSYWLTQKHVMKQIPWEFKHKVRPFCLSNQALIAYELSAFHSIHGSSLHPLLTSSSPDFLQSSPRQFTRLSRLASWSYSCWTVKHFNATGEQLVASLPVASRWLHVSRMEISPRKFLI